MTGTEGVSDFEGTPRPGSPVETRAGATGTVSEMEAGDDLRNLVKRIRNLSRANDLPARRLALMELSNHLRLEDDNSVGSPTDQIEVLLAHAMNQLADERYRAAAECLLRRNSGTNLTGRRYRASDAFGVSYERFRKRYEPEVLAEVANQIQWSSRNESAQGHLVPDSSSANSSSLNNHSMLLLERLDLTLNSIRGAVLLFGETLIIKDVDKLLAVTLSTNQESYLALHPELLTDVRRAMQFVSTMHEHL